MAFSTVKRRLKECSETSVNAADEAKKIGGEDPRKIIHAAKVGLAMAAVSLFYYFDIFHDGYKAGSGLYAMWAVITVVVVFEFSVGATIGKVVNRTFATLLGGALGVGARGATAWAGNTAEHIMLALIIFLISGAATFARFIPKLKARNEYCFVVIMVTFDMIALSTYRGQKLTHMAGKRLITVVIGCATVLICCCICPCWAGEDLHNLIAANINTLATFLEGFGGEYFETPSPETRASMNGYKALLNSKTAEESLANFAEWEPRHGKFRYWHPWEQYLRIGRLTRECASRVDSLNACLDSDVQAPLEIRTKMKEECTEMSRECSKALRELAVGMKTMTRPTPAGLHLSKAEAAATSLKSLLQTRMWADATLLEVCPAASVASLLLQIVSCTASIADSVQELANLAKFKDPDSVTEAENVIIVPVNLDNSHHSTTTDE